MYSLDFGRSNRLYALAVSAGGMPGAFTSSRRRKERRECFMPE